MVEELVQTDPFRRLEIPAGLDLQGIDAKILEVATAAGGPIRFDPNDGSNNWVVDGTLTATGKPLLANDPHRPITLPSVRYLVHLVGPGWNVIGSGEPALPGVAIGHNERIGFGITIYAISHCFSADRRSSNSRRKSYHSSGLGSGKRRTSENSTQSLRRACLRGEFAPGSRSGNGQTRKHRPKIAFVAG